jgi:hypothetical protein
MPSPANTFRRGSQDDLLHLAHVRGWIESAASTDSLDPIPPVRFVDVDSDGLLPAVTLKLRQSYRIKIPQALIHGRNLALFVEDWVFPGGIAHAFIASSDWGKRPDGLISFEPSRVETIGSGAELLGVVSHWGHFFVDALDRLLYRPTSTGPHQKWLVADADIFHLRPVTDPAGFIPQVTDLVNSLLPGAIDFASTQSLPRGNNFIATDLHLSTLRATKPAVNGEALRVLRERAFATLVEEQQDLGDAIFVGRRDVKKRFLIGQEEFCERLERAHGMRKYFPEDHALLTSIRQFANAQQVILPVGSAKFNLTFCEPGTKVVCITPTGYAAQNGAIVQTVRHICESLHLRLAFYGVAVQGHSSHAINQDMILTPEDVDPIMRLMESL